jgi:hypothetical protein
MREQEEPGFARAVRERYQRSATLGDDARQRLLERLRAAPPPRRPTRWGRWAPGPGGVTPLRVAFAAAGLVLVVGSVLVGRVVGPTGDLAPRVAPITRSELALVRFELAAPGAAGVSLVGDFNDWDPHATPMRRTHASATWSVSLPVAHGRHVYGFVVDGRRWVPDPSAPLAPEDDFGSASSVVVVTGRES